MNKNIKAVCREIKQGTNLEMNIPNYFNRLVTVYEEYATLNLTMNYYTYYENYLESTFVKSSDEKKVLDEINTLIKDFILSDFTGAKFSGAKMEEGIKRVDSIRNFITKQMQILTSYTDIFLVYEYVLERMQYRYTDSFDIVADEEFATEIFNYIFAVQDNMIINDKIKEVLGELPVRMTKNKYFDLLRDSISIYKNGDKESLDNYLYILETATTLYEADDMKDTYVNLLDIKNEFEALDYGNLSKEQFDIYADKLKNVTIFMNDRVDFYYGLQEIVNYLYTILLVTPYAYMDGGYRLEGMEGSMKYLILPPGQDDNICYEIIRDINNLFIGESKDLEDTEEKLSKLEGIQEKLWDEILILEPTLDDISMSYEKVVNGLMLTPIYKSLKYAQNLLSNSIFIELNQEDKDGIADEIYIKKVQDELVLKLSELFNKSSKQVVRGIMASTLNKMPVFFNTSEEIINYIKNSLSQCSDLAEKMASIEIIKDMCEI